MTWELWAPFPADWLPDTNAALELWHGYAFSCGIAHARGQRVRNVNLYNEHARVVRLAACLAARVAKLPKLPLVDLAYQARGFDTWDADAWAIPCKWFTDGLRDARVLRNDRRAIRHVGGLVLREWSGPSGIYLTIREVEHVAG